MSAVQGFVLVFQMALLAFAVAAKLGVAPPMGVAHEVFQAPAPANIMITTNALL